METPPRPSSQATNRKLGFSLRNGDIGGGDRSRLRREWAVIEVLQTPRTSHVPAGLAAHVISRQWDA